MDWLKENIVAFVGKFGWKPALVVIVVLVLLAVFVAWALGVDVGDLLGSVNWNGWPKGGAA